MKEIKGLPAFLLIAIISGQAVYGQDGFSRNRIGIMTGYGIDVSDLGFRTDYDYNVYLLIFQHQFTIIHHSSWDLEWLTQPQLNLARFRNSRIISEKSSNYEYGINAGFLIRRRVNGLSSVYMALCTGPHYISACPDRQRERFIFSDNLIAGCTFILKRNMSIDLRCNYRHMSNGGIEKPNGGIDNLMISAGILWSLPFR